MSGDNPLSKSAPARSRSRETSRPTDNRPIPRRKESAVRRAPFAQLIRISTFVILSSFVLCPSSFADDTVSFNRDIRPILSDNCFYCHGPDPKHREADLRLDTLKGVTEDRDGSVAVVPGDPDASQLVQRIMDEDADFRMPPPETEKHLTSEQIDLLRRWIAAGAEYEQHWSFVSVQRPALPSVRDAALTRNAIDYFVLAKLDKRNISPSPEADRVTLIRRLSLDLLGLPPTPDEVDAFVGDTRPDAYERLVERLLADPHFGQRWGRHWLDQARYADSNGYAPDGERTMWPYRDWVIRAINRDLPFDQFTIEQLAGDLLPNPTLEQLVATGFHRNTLINTEGGTKADQFRVEQAKDRVDTTGTVWLALTVGCANCHTHKFDPIEQKEYYELYAFFDSTQDQNSTTPTVSVPTAAQQTQLEQLNRRIAELNKQLAEPDPQRPQRRAEWERKLMETAEPKDLAAIVAKPFDKRSKEEQAKLDQAFERADPLRGPLQVELESLDSKRKDLAKAIPTAMVMRELATPRDTRIHIRGDFLRPGDAVQPNVPAALPSLIEVALRSDATSAVPSSIKRATRLDFANWLVRPNNPLTARVYVNRVWMRLFGRGIVETENDFGMQGSPPAHPELLDWLAAEFMHTGWSTKKLIESIVTSATYRQSSTARKELARIDARNDLLARQNRIRVEAEIVRDVGLAASGLLTDKLGGPSVFPPQPDGVYAFTQVQKSWRTSAGEDRYRRGMYTFLYRSAPHPMLTTFDVPSLNQTCTRRDRSNTPLQSLTMANDEAMFEMTQALARRVLSRTGPLTRPIPSDLPSSQDTESKQTDGSMEPSYSDDDTPHLVHMFRLCLAREPIEAERTFLLDYLNNQRQHFSAQPDAAKSIAVGDWPADVSPADAAAWTATARVLLNLDEFITRE